MSLTNYDAHAERKSWLSDPLDIIAAIDAIKKDKPSFTRTRDGMVFLIFDAGYCALDKTLPLYRFQAERNYVPMGFYTMQELQDRLDSVK